MSDNTTLFDSLCVDTIEDILTGCCERLKPSKKCLNTIIQYAGAYDAKMIKNKKIEFLNN